MEWIYRNAIVVICEKERETKNFKNIVFSLFLCKTTIAMLPEVKVFYSPHDRSPNASVESTH